MVTRGLLPTPTDFPPLLPLAHTSQPESLPPPSKTNSSDPNPQSSTSLPLSTLTPQLPNSSPNSIAPPNLPRSLSRGRSKGPSGRVRSKGPSSSRGPPSNPPPRRRESKGKRIARPGPPAPPAPPSSRIERWTDLFPNGPSSSSHPLKFFDPILEDQDPLAVIDDEDCAEALDYWSNCVVGYIIGTVPVYTPFLQFLKRLWKLKGEIKLLLRGNGFFLIKFFLPEDMQMVLEGGPWTMANRPFIMRKWTPDSQMEQARLSSIPVWVRIPYLPLHLWSSNAISKITSLIGTPLFMDTPTRMRTRISYARVCVEVQAGTNLPDFVCVRSNGELIQLPVLYDWKPQACSACSTFGHDNAMCGKFSHPSGAPSAVATRLTSQTTTSSLKPLSSPPTVNPSESLPPTTSHPLAPFSTTLDNPSVSPLPSNPTATRLTTKVSSQPTTSQPDTSASIPQNLGPQPPKSPSQQQTQASLS
ncbi:hypothetical protein QJS04_geneDACA020178 [Acorus gramineus]|uniref:DUF4283 domain-containing protein n=1 Tax=Acorus gramineus TaxID=55184 RepID=A0AAV9BR55_ACOGR|nr:hypothetical protein QJS04_geneDACA020178 [Acorus gramineus]